jgi:putative transposase
VESLARSEFGSASFVHKYFLEWKKKGALVKLWRKGLVEYDEIAWSWKSIDRAMVKAPMALEAIGPNPTDRRGKNWTKRSVLVDGRGIPLSLVVSGAQKHDVKLSEPNLDHIEVKRPEGKERPCASV